jgi:hypothetical protein
VELDRARTYSMQHTFRAGGALVLDAIDDVESKGLAFGTVVPASPIRLRIQERRKVGDFFMGPWPVKIVSPRFVEVLRAGDFSGWTTFPIGVIGRLSEELREHRGLAVTGRSGPPDRSREERVVLPPPVPNGEAMPHRLGLHPQDWDGSDLFVPEGTTHICVSERVRDAVARARLTGVEFTRLTEYVRADLDALDE